MKYSEKNLKFMFALSIIHDEKFKLLNKNTEYTYESFIKFVETNLCEIDLEKEMIKDLTQIGLYSNYYKTKLKNIILGDSKLLDIMFEPFVRNHYAEMICESDKAKDFSSSNKFIELTDENLNCTVCVPALTYKFK